MKNNAETKKTPNRRQVTGVVTRRSGDKTVAVTISRVTVHPLYQKRQTRTKTYLAHDPENQAAVGDQVTLRESRPLSRRKRWTVVGKTGKSSETSQPANRSTG